MYLPNSIHGKDKWNEPKIKFIQQPLLFTMTTREWNDAKYMRNFSLNKDLISVYINPNKSTVQIEYLLIE